MCFVGTLILQNLDLLFRGPHTHSCHLIYFNVTRAKLLVFSFSFFSSRILSILFLEKVVKLK